MSLLAALQATLLGADLVEVVTCLASPDWVASKPDRFLGLEEPDICPTGAVYYVPHGERHYCVAWNEYGDNEGVWELWHGPHTDITLLNHDPAFFLNWRRDAVVLPSWVRLRSEPVYLDDED